MSPDNVEIVRAAFRLFDEGDIESIVRLTDERIEITQPAQLPGVNPRQYGHAGVRESFGIWPEQWDDFRVEVVRATELHQRVVVTTIQRGRGKSSGIEVEMHFTMVFTLRDGKITEWRIFTTEAEALKAVGLED
jgi:ketosteroid isomerase-like protein